MPPSVTPITDPARLVALRRTALLDSSAEETFDRLTRIASKVLGVPISLVSLVDEERQFFKSQIGLPEDWANARQTPLSHSFCKHVVLTGEPLIVSDARLHPLLKDNPAVLLGVIAYAGVPLISSDGFVLGSFCAIDNKPRAWTSEQIELLRDVTAAVLTEIELRRTNEELRRANVAKDRFMAMLSHDLRTPLSPALMTAADLANDPSLPEAVREDVQLIQRNIQLEVRMIDSLLDLTRITTGKLQLTEETLDVRQEIRAAAELCRAEADAKNLELKFELAADPQLLRGDSAKLQQVFSNLLKNAIKFNGQGGLITLRASRISPGWIRVQIADTGVGIPHEVLARIFEPYEQGESAITQRFGGLGLGLAICKGIVEAHGGSVAAASPGKGHGATMTVLLPTTNEPLGAPAQAEPSAQANRANLSILLVEDHEDSLRAMSRLLRKLDHRVTTATTVSNALEVANGLDFDLLISDVGLPDGTGLQLIEQLLKRGPVKGIALTGYGTESDVQEAKAAGFQTHLTKPIQFHELETAIREIL